MIPNRHLLQTCLGVLTLALGFASHASAQTTLLAGFDFQTVGNTTAASPNTPTSYTAPFGVFANTATLSLNGTNGSSTYSPATELSAFGGTTVNAGPGFATSTSGASSLAILGGTSNSANGKSIVFSLSTVGYENLVLTFATQGTSTGFKGNTFSYSTDGSNFTALSGVSITPATSFATATADFSAVAAIDNAPTVYIRYTLNGATSTSGNNRLDNIQFNATAVPEPATVAGGLLLIGVAGWSQRRRFNGLVRLPA